MNSLSFDLKRSREPSNVHFRREVRRVKPGQGRR
jgi:hypothetical protein